MRVLKPEEVADLIVSEVIVVRYSAVDHCIVGVCELRDMLHPHAYITTYIVVEVVPKLAPIFSIQVVGLPPYRIIYCGGVHNQHTEEARFEIMCYAVGVNPHAFNKFIESLQPRMGELMHQLSASS